jgi:hypothetical protein
LGTIPAATGIAILKYRLYEIDLIINRTLVYGSLTAMYFGGVAATRPSSTRAPVKSGSRNWLWSSLPW